ncbi:MAG: hypothetical protein EXR82_02760 [Gammaproteobacteria bacterium]|nr:hypothetical protein [Gammaproteobacteria bacterium]
MPRFLAVPGLWSLAHLPVNGHAVGLRIDVASFSGDILNDVYALGAAVTFTNLAITAGGETVIGDGSLEIDLDFTLPLISETAESGSLEGARFEGAVNFFALSPLVATGATIRATVQNAQTVQLAIDVNGDGLVDDTQQVPWSSLGGFWRPERDLRVRTSCS